MKEKQKQRAVQVFGAAVTNDEIEALVDLAVQVKKTQKNYKIYVATFGIIGAIMVLLGLATLKSGTGWIILICAVFILWLVMVGVMMTTRTAFRNTARALNDTNYTPVFGEDGIQVRSDDETEQTVPWSRFDAFTRTDHGLWIITEKGRTGHMAIYVNGDQTQPAMMDEILRLLADNHIEEIETQA